MRVATVALGLAGVVIGLLVKLVREDREEKRTDIVPRWKAFMETPAAKGEPEISPLSLPAVRELKGVKTQAWKTRRFQQRGRA